MRAGVPPDISYGIQCSEELFNITGDVVTYYYRFNDADLTSRIDALEHDPNHPRDIDESLRRYARIYMDLYNNWFWSEQGTRDERTWAVASATEGFGRQAAERIEYWLTHYISDMLRLGCDPELRANQQRWLDADRSVHHCEKIVGQLARKASTLPLDDMKLAILEPARFVNRLPSQEDLQRCFVTGNTVEGELYIGTYTDMEIALPKRVIRARDRERKHVLKKAVRFLQTVMHPEDVTLFVGGKEIRVEGQRYVFVLTKGWLLSETHGGVKVSVRDKQADRRLFDLCWYVQDTPALDQVAALALAVKAGEEDEIVRVGNKLRVDYDATDELRPDLGLERYKSSGILGPEGIRFPDEDTLLHLTRGTMEYHRSRPDLYYDFSARCSKRLLRNRFAEPLVRHFTPHRPDQLRRIANGRVERNLFREGDVPLLGGGGLEDDEHTGRLIEGLVEA